LILKEGWDLVCVYLLLIAITAATAAITITMTTIPTTSAVLITGFVTVTVLTAVVVVTAVVVAVLVTVAVVVTVDTAVVVVVVVVVDVVVDVVVTGVVVVVVVVVDVVTGVYVVWKYEATQACNCGSGLGKPIKTAHLWKYGLVQRLPLMIAWANGGITPGGAKAPMTIRMFQNGSKPSQPQPIAQSWNSE